MTPRERTAIALYRAKVRMRSICAATGLSAWAIRKLARARGMKLRPTGGPRKYDARQRAQAMQILKHGASVKDAADALGVSTDSVRLWAKQHEVVATVDRRRHSKLVRERAVHLYVVRGFSSGQTAEILGDGIDPHTVVRWVKDAGGQAHPSNRTPRIDDQNVAKLHAAGFTAQQIAYGVRCSVGAIYKSLRRHRAQA